MLQGAWFGENQGRAFFLLVAFSAKRRKAVTRRAGTKWRSLEAKRRDLTA
jgi:hypothetical protein